MPKHNPSRRPTVTARAAGPTMIIMAVIVAGIMAGIIAACGTVPSQPGPTTPGPGPSSVQAPAPSPTPSPTPAPCPGGSYRITALKGQGSAAKLGSGTGGDATLTFTDGTFTLQSDGQDPIELDLGPTRAALTLTGDVTGSYTGDASALSMQVQDATGTAVVKGPFVDQRLTMRQLADQLVPADTVATATCAADQATLTLPDLTLSLTRS